MKKPKILFYDIETSPLEIHTWGLYDQNSLNMIKDWTLMSFAYKWGGEKSIKVLARPDFKDKTDKTLVKALWKLIDEADILIGHNSDAFDNKKATAKFIEHGLTPPSPSQTVDTCKVAKKYFRFTSNKLDDLGKLLGVGRKEKTGGIDLWLECIAGSKSAWAKMKKYNKQDVALLERVYLKLLPWINNHPNVAFLADKVDACPKCGSENLQRRGYHCSKTQKYRRINCGDCGGWCRERVAETVVKPRVVNG